MPFPFHLNGHFLIAFDTQVTVNIIICSHVSPMLLSLFPDKNFMSTLYMPRFLGGIKQCINHREVMLWPGELSLSHFRYINNVHL